MAAQAAAAAGLAMAILPAVAGLAAAAEVLTALVV